MPKCGVQQSWPKEFCSSPFSLEYCTHLITKSSNKFSFIFCRITFDVILTFPIIGEISHFSPETFITVGKEWILQQVLKLGLSQKSRQIDIVLEKIFLISPEIVWYFGKQWQTNIRFRKLEQRKWKWKTCWQSSKVLFSKEN